jgi:hypothetical protein
MRHKETSSRNKMTHSGLRHMKSREWKTYRTRFLVKARQLSSSLSFEDSLGRQHSGRKGDYLVESSEGIVSIAPRQIFEDIYVAMSPGEDLREFGAIVDTRAARKLPQSCRERRVSNSRLGLL